MHADTHDDRQHDGETAAIRRNVTALAAYLGYEVVEDLLDLTLAVFVGGENEPRIEGNLHAVSAFIQSVAVRRVAALPYIFEAA